jgi:ABC transporter transmembrane region
VLAATKGTPEYEKLFNRLSQINYKHQKDNQTANPEDVKARVVTGVTESARKNNQVVATDSNEENAIESAEGKKLNFNKDKHLYGVGYGRIMSYYRPHILVLVMLLCACVNSFSWAALGLVSAKFQYIMIGMIYNPSLTTERDKWVVYWFLVCLGIGIICGVEKILFGIMGEKLTYEIRKELLRGVVFKQLSWFDHENRAPGILTNVFSEDVSNLNGMTTETLSTVIEAGLSLVIAISIACIYCWQLSLLVAISLPIMLVGVVFMSRLQWGNKGGKSEGTVK